MRTFSGKFYYDQKPLIASHMEFLLQKAYSSVDEKLSLLCANQLNLSICGDYVFLAIKPLRSGGRGKA